MTFRETKRQGDTIRWPVLYETPVDPTAQPVVYVAVNLSGYTVEAHILRVSDRTDVATMSVTIANQGTDPGEFELLLADSSSLTPGEYVVDVRFTEPDTDSVSTESWSLVIEPEVTPR